jgi:fused signal recognition particle receptor
MFGLLKKKLKESVDKLTQRAAEKPEEPAVKPEEPVQKPVEKAEEPTQEPAAKAEDKGKLVKIREKITTKQLSEKDIDGFFSEMELELLQANVAFETVEFLKSGMKKRLVDRNIKRTGVKEFIAKAFEESLLETVDQGDVDIMKLAKEKRPLKCVFLGFNGSGKTTSIAKTASYLKGRGITPVIAAGDTFRAASIEQLGVHAEKLDVKLVKHEYGADAAAVIFDAVKYAENNHCGIVLADTAGRVHTDRNLMDELRKIIRVNQPDLNILVVDSLTGNDAVEQARQFNDAVGVDAVIMTKVDVNEKGGSILSVCHAIRKPILFLGVGQGYGDIEMFKPKEFVRNLLE